MSEDFDELMDESECANCLGNGWECDCTDEEIAEAEKAIKTEFRKRRKPSSKEAPGDE